MREARVGSAMERCSIEDVERRPIGQLSKGYRQRVGLADTLLADPKILILDEPTVGLDPNQIRETRRLIKDLGQTHTVLLSTHILPEVGMICDHVIIIHRGKVAAAGTPRELMEKVAGSNEVILEAQGPADRIEPALRAIEGVTSVKRRIEEGRTVFYIEGRGNADVRADVSRRLAERGWPILDLHRRTATLEDVFVSLTMRED